MGGFIVIDGMAFWVILALTIIGIIVSAYLLYKLLYNYFSLLEQNAKLKQKLSRTEQAYYKATFKTPSIDKKE
jgi:uncharacterized membrane protein